MPDLAPRIDRLGAYEARLAGRSRRISAVRLAIVVLGLAGVVVAVRSGSALAAWGAAVVAIGLFGWAVRVHERVERARAQARLYRGLLTRELDRRRLAWAGLGPAPPPATAGHPFASDLDVAGPRSLLHLVDTTGTRGGSLRLRRWMLAETPDADAARTRQAQARALVPRRRLRERLALLGHRATGALDERWSDRALLTWLDAEPDPTLRRWAVGLSALAATTAALLVVSLAGGPSLWGLSFVVYVLLYLWRFASMRAAFDEAYDLQRALDAAAPMLDWLERDPAAADPVLAPVWAPLRGADRPSVHLGQLRRITAAAALTRNDVGQVVLNAILPYDLLLALALGRLRQGLSGVLEPWLDALYRVEALGALAAMAERDPGATFPELRGAAAAGPLLDARELRHPLLPPAEAVGNGAALDAGGVVILTGSNMSGKSTFLRAVGLASVVAWAGGPVPAASLALAPLRTVTSMRIGDTLQEGISTFYAEVRRLKVLLDAATDPAATAPALVLIDEMLRGTNNRERLAGAQAIVRALADARATSMVATHDLALAELEGERDGIRNAHFRETAEGDRLVFDYRLRPGPCPTTNALVIMRNAGLPVGGGTHGDEPQG